MHILEWPDLTPDPHKVYRAMGTANSEKDISPVVAETIDRMRSRAGELIKARCGYVLVPVNVTAAGQVILDHCLALDSVSRFFRGAAQVVIAVATIGPGLEGEVSRLFKNGQFLEGLTMDAYGTAALDELSGMLRQEVTKEASARRQKAGYGLSPGCQAMPLEEQRVIFSFLEGKKIGVELTDACLMLPIKSSSVIIPVGEELAMPNQSNHMCELCGQRQSCNFRSGKLSLTKHQDNEEETTATARKQD